MLHKDILYDIFKKINSKSLIRASLSCTKTHHVFKKYKKYFAFDLSLSNITNNGLKYIYGCSKINLAVAHKITQKGLIKLLRSNTVTNINISHTN